MNRTHRRLSRALAIALLGTTAVVATNVDAPARAAVAPSMGGHLMPGVYCNGWIHRSEPPMHVHVIDKTNGRMPSATDCAKARDFYNKVKAATAKYADFNVAVKNNYRRGKDSPEAKAMHFVHWGKFPQVLDPNHPEGLMYVRQNGKMKFLGAMFVEYGNNLPQPGGSLTAWHTHDMDMKMFHVWTFAGNVDPFATGLPAAQQAH